MDGWIILDKPVGLGSTQAVAKVKRALREAGWPKRKVGHGGTLDPLASGVLPIAIGEATKLCGRMLDADKVYEFTIAFGVETDTLDGEGTVIATSDARPTSDAVAAVLPRFIGAIAQVPPAFSALKVAGRRAYDLARSGEDVALASRRVTVRALQILPGTGRGTAEGGGGGPASSGSSAEGPLHHAVHGPPLRAGEELHVVTFLAHVSKGTYIRSLARDIARALGTIGIVAMLRRTRAGPFGLAHAISLDTLREKAMARDLESVLLPLEAGLDGIPALDLTPDQARLLRQGRKLIGNAAPGLHLARDAGVPVALVEADGPEIRVVRGLNPMPKEDDA